MSECFCAVAMGKYDALKLAVCYATMGLFVSLTARRATAISECGSDDAFAIFERVVHFFAFQLHMVVQRGSNADHSAGFVRVLR